MGWVGAGAVALLVPGGWLAVTDVDDLLGHGPLEERWRKLVAGYDSRSLDEGLHSATSTGAGTWSRGAAA